MKKAFLGLFVIATVSTIILLLGFPGKQSRSSRETSDESFESSIVQLQSSENSKSSPEQVFTTNHIRESGFPDGNNIIDKIKEFDIAVKGYDSMLKERTNAPVNVVYDPEYVKRTSPDGTFVEFTEKYRSLTNAVLSEAEINAIIDSTPDPDKLIFKTAQLSSGSGSIRDVPAAKYILKHIVDKYGNTKVGNAALYMLAIANRSMKEMDREILNRDRILENLQAGGDMDLGFRFFTYLNQSAYYAKEGDEERANMICDHMLEHSRMPEDKAMVELIKIRNTAIGNNVDLDTLIAARTKMIELRERMKKEKLKGVSYIDNVFIKEIENRIKEGE